MAIFPKTIFHWDVNSVGDVNEASLSLFWLIEPKIDILLIGVGDRGLTIDPKVRLFLARKHINVEVMATADAVPLFNFLNIDRRNVAAALIPPTNVEFNNPDSDVIDLAAVRGRLFKDVKMAERQGIEHDETMRKVNEAIERAEAEQARREEEEARKPPKDFRKW